jgi:hypothetical protein
MQINRKSIESIIEKLSPRDIKTLRAMIDAYVVSWRPESKPQELAYYSKADVIGFGGAAGGGKTSLLCGLALAPWHKQIEVIRKEAKQTDAIRQEIAGILRDSGKSFKNPKHGNIEWGEKVISFSSMKDPDSHLKAQGIAKDFKAFDEVTSIPRHQVEWSMNWNRSADPDVRCQTLMTFNPPVNPEGRWVLSYFAPWIDPLRTKKAESGEVLYIATINQLDRVLDKPDPFVIYNGDIVYDFDPEDFKKEEIVTPRTRTFIQSKITDNKFLMGTSYFAAMQNMADSPEKQALFYGDMSSCLQDGAMQLFKTDWIKEAFKRYEELPKKERRQTQIGVDVAWGGRDKTAISQRFEGNVFTKIQTFSFRGGSIGKTIAEQVMQTRKHNSTICVDVLGVGASPYDFLLQEGLAPYQELIPVRVSQKSYATYQNFAPIALVRDELHYNLAWMLNPANNTGIAIEQDPDLMAEMEAVEYYVESTSAKVSSRDDMIKKIGRSPDKLSALLMAAMSVNTLRGYSLPKVESHLSRF